MIIVKKVALLLCVMLIMPAAAFAPGNREVAEKNVSLGKSTETSEMMFRDFCDIMAKMNKTGIKGQDDFVEGFEGNPVIMAILAMNESITMKVDYNGTECVRLHLIVENSTLKGIEFGEFNVSGIYIKVDIAFLEDIRERLVGFEGKEGKEKLFDVLWVVRKFVASFFNGSFEIKPFSAVFKFFDVLISVAKSM